ncbi:MAG: hypothetical protein V7785_22500 [Bermanella sp.]
MAVTYFKGILLAACGLAVLGCKPASPEQDGSQASRQALTYDYTLSQSEFNSLSATDQYMVANKALSSMYRGVAVDEFFDLTKGLNNPVVSQTNFMSELQTRLQTSMSSAELTAAYNDTFGTSDKPDTEVDESIPARFTSLDDDHPHQRYMARMQNYPISRDQFVTWMSYFLANTIMFSPAREMDSTESQDITRVLGYLKLSLEGSTPIRDVVRGWLNNLSRWRVSRSPENHALEMFELYLGIFNDTPEEQQNTINGGIACNNWYLTDNNGGYQLLPDPTRPDGAGATVQVFGQYINSCDELYDVVAGHALLIPRVTEVIVNYFLDGSSSATKSALIENIVASSPTTFDDIFLSVMFSKSFLLNNQRPKTFEENAFGFLNSMHYTPRTSGGRGYLRSSVLRYVLDSTNNSAPIAVHNMGWAAMDYKIGRTPFLPMDVLSFATYHKGIREYVLLDYRAYDGRSYPKTEDFTEAEEPRDPPFAIHNGAFYVAGTENLKPELESLNVNEFVDLVFMTALGRKADEVESSALIAEGVAQDQLREYEGVLSLRRDKGGNDELYEYWTDDFARVMLDYISRLPEFYYYRAVGQ